VSAASAVNHPDAPNGEQPYGGRRYKGFGRGLQWRHEINDFIRSKDAQEAAPGLPKPDEPAAPAEPSAGPEEPKPYPSGGEAATPPTEQTEIDALKRYGWDDEEIAAMGITHDSADRASREATTA
jgi:hypothetical protein